MTLNVVGGYYQVERYVAALEDLPRALRLTVLTVAPGVSPVDPKPVATGSGVSEAAAAEAAAEEAAKLTDGRHLAMTITANVYIASQEPVAAPAAPAAQPTSQETS